MEYNNKLSLEQVQREIETHIRKCGDEKLEGNLLPLYQGLNFAWTLINRVDRLNDETELSNRSLLLKMINDKELADEAWSWLSGGKGVAGRAIIWELSSINEDGTYDVAWAGTSDIDTYSASQIVGMALWDGWDFF